MAIFTEHPGKHVADITLYALSYCPYCKATKQFLNENDIEYKYVDVDLVPQAEAGEVLAEVQQYNPDDTFPTMVVNGGEEVIVGFNQPEIARVISSGSPAGTVYRAS